MNEPYDCPPYTWDLGCRLESDAWLVKKIGVSGGGSLGIPLSFEPADRRNLIYAWQQMQPYGPLRPPWFHGLSDDDAFRRAQFLVTLVNRDAIERAYRAAKIAICDESLPLRVDDPDPAKLSAEQSRKLAKAGENAAQAMEQWLEALSTVWDSEPPANEDELRARLERHLWTSLTGRQITEWSQKGVVEPTLGCASASILAAKNLAKELAAYHRLSATRKGARQNPGTPHLVEFARYLIPAWRELFRKEPSRSRSGSAFCEYANAAWKDMFPDRAETIGPRTISKALGTP